MSNCVYVLCEPIRDALWRRLPYGNVLSQRRAGAADAGGQKPLVTDLPNPAGTRLSLSTARQDASVFDLLNLGRKLVASHLEQQPRALAVVIAGFDLTAAERVAEAVLAAILAGSAELPTFKSKPPRKRRLARIALYGHISAHGFARTFAAAEGNTLARRLSMLPPNKLTPGEYLRQIRDLARQHGWSVTFYDRRYLRRKGAGAFLAVAQGSPEEDAGIVRVRYRPARGAGRRPLCLVGKGVCYDTGGTNLKPHKAMFGMHEDMQGSAVALGTLLALTRLRASFPVEAWLALSMNLIGPRSYKPNDVVAAADGTTIEVVHTDAEGRMLLADTLVLASQARPAAIIDYATLTSACIHALGSAYSGVFTNRPEWQQKLIEAGRLSGERVWPFPLDEDYDKLLESRIADVRQCALDSGVDHILAARFLKRFVKHDTPWIHVDLSASHRKGGLAHVPTDTTGFGVRFTLGLLEQGIPRV